MNGDGLYPIIHLKGDDIEIAMTHGRQYGEEYYSFVNGQHTTQGGTHLAAFREAVGKTIREFYKKDFDTSDIRTSIIGAISIKVQEPVFESQTKTKLGSKDMGPDGPTVRNFIMDFISKELDNYLHRNPDTAELLLRKIVETERERKAMAGVQKMARGRNRSACTTGNCGIAGYTSIPITNRKTNRLFLSPRGIRQAVPSPSRVM
jgi:topoisomerase-4 subunit B